MIPRTPDRPLTWFRWIVSMMIWAIWWNSYNQGSTPFRTIWEPYLAITGVFLVCAAIRVVFGDGTASDPKWGSLTWFDVLMVLLVSFAITAATTFLQAHVRIHWVSDPPAATRPDR